jgi:CRP-like cAMP-binding protein
MIAIMFNDLFDHMADKAGQRLRFQEGGYLFHRDDPVRQMFAVASGSVDLVRPQADGKPIILQQAGSRTVLAEASLYSQRYHCDGVVHADAIIIGVARQAFLNLLESDKSFAGLWASHLAREVQNARYRSEILTRKTVAERLDAWLDWHGETLPQKGRWKNMAAQIGVSPEALYRELARRRKNSQEEK